jgi:hypothetical protein
MRADSKLKGVRPKAKETLGAKKELPAFFYRLSARAQRCYLKSDAIERFELNSSPAALNRTAFLMRVIEHGEPAATEKAAQALIAELCRLLGVKPVRIEVRGVRPRNARAELHGIFYPARMPRPGAPGASAPAIILWMRTAQRHDIVKPKTFLRTLVHELGHYLDYTLLKLEDSYHTQGFFKRESSLVRALRPPS